MIASRIVIWFSWLGTLYLSIAAAVFLAPKTANLNSFERSFDLFNIGIFVIAVFFCGGFRWWVSATDHPVIVLIPYLLGMYFTYGVQNFGYFLVPSHCIVFQILGAISLLAYFPGFVAVRSLGRPEPPPLNSRPEGDRR